MFKTYDAELEGKVGVPEFSFVLRDLVASKHISSRVVFDDVIDLLDEVGDNCIYLNSFIKWLESVRVLILFRWFLYTFALYLFLLCINPIYFLRSIFSQDPSTVSNSKKCKIQELFPFPMYLSLICYYFSQPLCLA